MCDRDAVTPKIPDFAINNQLRQESDMGSKSQTLILITALFY